MYIKKYQSPAEPHPHEVRNSWLEAYGVWKSEECACTLGALQRILQVQYHPNNIRITVVFT
jgi:hypothetical protein